MWTPISFFWLVLFFLSLGKLPPNTNKIQIKFHGITNDNIASGKKGLKLKRKGQEKCRDTTIKH